MFCLGLVNLEACRRWLAPAAAIFACALALAACSGGGSRYGPRVVELGQPVPKGGGGYKVGSAYRINGRTYMPQEVAAYDRTGIASWYGEDFHGRRTANGEIYDMEALTVAHPTLPLPSYVRITNLRNGRTLVARVNDRGPYVDNRIIDLSWAVASLLQIESAGTGQVRVQYLGPAPIDGDDRQERQMLAQQPWAGPRVAFASSPAKALRSLSAGGGQYSSNETVVREKLFREKLVSGAVSPERQWLIPASEPMPQQQAAASASGTAGAADKQKPVLVGRDQASIAAQALLPAARQQRTKPATQPARTAAAASPPANEEPAGAAPATIGTAFRHTAPVRLASAKAGTARPAALPAKAKPSAAQVLIVGRDQTSIAGGSLVGRDQTSIAAQVQAKPENAKPEKAKPEQAKPEQAKLEPEKPSTVYIEAGVFRERALADRLATILTEIAPANVELTTSGTEIVHRLRVGPFTKNETAQNVVDRIRSAGLTEAHVLTAHGI